MARRRRETVVAYQNSDSDNVVVLVPGIEELGREPESMVPDRPVQATIRVETILLTDSLNQYQEMALRTRGSFGDSDSLINFSALEIASEAGEVANKVYKHQYQGHPLNIQDLVEELGDVMWGIASMADALGVSLHYVASSNISKLAKRYPDGRFTTKDSISRVDHLESGVGSGVEDEEGGGAQGA